jgi:anti-anti-sigma factor
MVEYRYYLRDEVDLATAPTLRADLRQAVAATDAHLLIDCSHLKFIGSTGIAALLEANDELEADGRHMLIVNVPRGPRRVFEILGLSDLMHYDRVLV